MREWFPEEWSRVGQGSMRAGAQGQVVGRMASRRILGRTSAAVESIAM